MIWLIGGGLIQLVMLEAIKRRGYQVLVTDANPLCQGALLADEFVCLDTYDVDANLEYAKKFTKPEAVVTFGADVGPTVSALAKYYGLPAAKYESACAARNKGSMRMSLRAGMNQRKPEFWLVEAKKRTEFHSAEAWTSHVNDVRKEWEKAAKSGHTHVYPCVVKPTENCASRGMSVVESEGGWSSALEIAGRNTRGSKFVLIEEFVGGREFAMDWFVGPDGSVAYVMGVERVFVKPGVEFACTYPIDDTGLIFEMRQRVKRAAVCLDVQGPFKVDFTLSPDYGLLIGETATRQSGGVDQWVYPAVTGASPVDVALDFALGLPFDNEHVQIRKSDYGAHIAPIHNPGNIDGWTGVDDARAMPDVVDVYLRDLDVIRPLVDGAARPLFIAARGKSKNEAVANAVLAASKIKPNYK